MGTRGKRWQLDLLYVLVALGLLLALHYAFSPPDTTPQYEGLEDATKLSPTVSQALNRLTTGNPDKVVAVYEIREPASKVVKRPFQRLNPLSSDPVWRNSSYAKMRIQSSIAFHVGRLATSGAKTSSSLRKLRTNRDPAWTTVVIMQSGAFPKETIWSRLGL